MWWWLDRANNYSDYAEAIKHFTCPVQNIVFASKRGDIALWQQGEVPLRWPGQGVYLMPGSDDNYQWQGFIPQSENPHIVNPAHGFVSSANQRATDSTYPYFVPGDYAMYRGYTINRLLGSMQQITPDDMKRLQSNNHNTRAEMLRPLLLKQVDEAALDADEKRLLDLVRSWNLQNDPGEKGATVFETWSDSLSRMIWKDEFSVITDPIYPEKARLTDLLDRDSAFRFADDITTPRLETVRDMVTASLKIAAPFLLQMERENKLEWGQFKNTTIYHLLRTSAMPFASGGIRNGGGVEIINATSHSNGPSWRMVVHLSAVTEAYGVYPGGQSGNPGSYYYDNFVETWASGDYYPLWVMKRSDGIDKKVKWVLKLGGP
jgi:penicillin amidase